jgi:hypothetical protein
MGWVYFRNIERRVHFIRNSWLLGPGNEYGNGGSGEKNGAAIILCK